MYSNLLLVLILVLLCFVVNAHGIACKPVTSTALFPDSNNKKDVGLLDAEGRKRLDLVIGGLKFSLNISNTNFNKGRPKPAIPVETSWKTGFSGGVFLNIPLISSLSLQQEYLYTYLRSELKSDKVEYHLSYISLPILLNLKIKSRVSVVVGPQVDVLIQAKHHFNGQSSNIIHEVEERQIGVSAGASFKLSKSLHLGAKFIHGINHVGIRQTGNTKEFKLEQVQVGVLVELL